MTWRLAASVHRGRRGGRRPIEEALGSRSEDRGRGRGWTGRRKGTRAYKQKKGTTFLFLTMRVWGGFDEVRTRLRNQALLFFWFEEAKHFFHFFSRNNFHLFLCQAYCPSLVVLFRLPGIQLLQTRHFRGSSGLLWFRPGTLSIAGQSGRKHLFFIAKTPRFPKKSNTHAHTVRQRGQKTQGGV